MPTEEPKPVLDSEPGDLYTSEEPSSFPYPIPTEIPTEELTIPLEENFLASTSAPSDSPSEDIYIFPLPDSTAMFQTALYKAQMAFTVIAYRLTYAPAASLLKLESLKILIQEDDSAYPSCIPDYNK